MHLAVLMTIAVFSNLGVSVQEMLDNAVEAGAKVVVLPAGRVEVAGKLRVQGARNLVIDGSGTTLVFSDREGTTWSFNSCRNITLRGFTIDYDPLPFIQGRITGRSEDGRRYDFTVCEGYPRLREEDSEHYRQAYIFEPDEARWKPWVPDIYARQVEIVDGRHGRFIMGYVPKYHELIEVGDRIVLTLRSGGAIRMNDCENVRIEDVTFLAAPGCAYLGRYMRGDNYYRYTIKPGPPPTGASEPRLISTCADGLNIAFATKGPTIEGCRFSFMGDDSVNLHGAIFVVVNQPTPKELLVAWPYSRRIMASHGVIERNTFRRLKMSAITVGAEYEFWREAGWVEDVTIRDNTIVDVGRDGASHGSGAYVLGAISIFGRTDQGSERPLWPGNRDIIIEGSAIRDCPSAGIFAAAAADVQIRNNRLENCFFQPGESAGKARGLDVEGPIDVQHAKNVALEDNEITETAP